MKIDIIRAWKDRAYRESLSDEERASLPENPVGQIELTEAELEKIMGAGGSHDCHHHSHDCHHHSWDCHHHSHDCHHHSWDCHHHSHDCHRH